MKRGRRELETEEASDGYFESYGTGSPLPFSGVARAASRTLLTARRCAAFRRAPITVEGCPAVVRRRLPTFACHVVAQVRPRSTSRCCAAGAQMLM
jgi:hypothetical protein